jgi:hypothetical protein
MDRSAHKNHRHRRHPSKRNARPKQERGISPTNRINRPRPRRLYPAVQTTRKTRIRKNNNKARVRARAKTPTV